MTRKRTRRDESRREFVKTMAMAGGAAAVVSVTGTASADESVEMAPKSDRRDKKYKVTPHISTYYKKARI
jgi:nitrous oxide reductase